jgi:hypothetical protein
MAFIQRFVRFWYDFIVGDDPVIAVGVIIAMALTFLLTANDINAWWLLLIGVFAPLASSVFRATP